MAAVNSEEANALLNQHKIEYIFADCLLPGVSGDEFVIKLKKEKSRQEIQSHFDVWYLYGQVHDPRFVEANSNNGIFEKAI